MADTWVERERRTARLIRLCYATFVARRQPTAEQIYALCKLTWITKGGGNDLPDNTAATAAPALAALARIDLSAATPAELADELRAANLPKAMVTLAARPLGFVNYYGAFRNAAKQWLAAHRSEVWPLVRGVAEATDGKAVRAAYAALDSLPPVPRPVGGSGKPRNLLTPLFASLDERGRGPIINERKLWLLKKLGLAGASSAEQYDGLVGLIGQAGIGDSFALDLADEDQIEKAMRAVPRGQRATRPPKAPVSKSLRERRDEDVECLRAADTVKMRRIHNSMTNALRSICEGAGLEIEEGSEQTCLFDALVREYQGPERHLLIEVKTDHTAPMCRMAIGQLFDYRRLHPDRAAIDLAVLFPAKPSREALAFVAYVGVKALWFDHDMRNVTGDAVLQLRRRSKAK